MKILRPLPIVLLLVSLALFGIAVAVAPGWRRRALRAYGIGFIIVGLATLLARSLGGDAFVSSLAKTAAAEPAIREVWSISTELLNQVAVATIGYGVVMVAAALARRADTHRDRDAARRRAVLALTGDRVFGPGDRGLDPAVVGADARVAQRRHGADPGRPARRRGRGAAAADHPRVPDATREDANRRYRERWDNFIAGSRRRGESLRAGASRAGQSATGALASTRDAASERFSTPQSAEDARLQQLERLAQLREAGILSEEELKAEKDRILNPA